MSPAFKYRALRTALVWLRRIAVRYQINFDNAVESSAKALRSPASTSQKERD